MKLIKIKTSGAAHYTFGPSNIGYVNFQKDRRAQWVVKREFKLCALTGNCFYCNNYDCGLGVGTELVENSPKKFEDW